MHSIQVCYKKFRINIEQVRGEGYAKELGLGRINLKYLMMFILDDNKIKRGQSIVLNFELN